MSGPGAARVSRAESFARRRADAWRRFRHEASEFARASSVPPDRVVPFARAYRAIAADLSAARALGCAPNVTNELNALVALGHAVVYRSRLGPPGATVAPAWRRFLVFAARGFPATLHAHAGAVLAAAALFFLPAAAGYFWVGDDPGRIHAVFPSLDSVISPHGDRQGSITATPAQMTSFYWINNSLAALLCFAAGFAGGIGTAYCLALNGLLLGALAASFESHGALGRFLADVLPHGVPEILALVLAGAGGLLIAKAQWRPGEWSRGDAVIRAAREAAPIVGGAILLVFLAGIIEANFTRTTAEDAPRHLFAAVAAIGVAAWIAQGAVGRGRAG